MARASVKRVRSQSGSNLRSRLRRELVAQNDLCQSSVGLVVGHEVAGRDAPGQQPTRFILHGHGVAVQDSHRFWRATVEVARFRCPGLPELEVPAFTWTGRLVPWALVRQAIRFFRHVDATCRTEALVWLVHQDGDYRLVVPQQTVSAASVRTDEVPPEGSVLVAELHSHPGSMDEHSGVDDRDEDGRLVLSGVVSHLRTTPRVALRAVTPYGVVPVSVGDICEVPTVTVTVPVLCGRTGLVVGERLYGEAISQDPWILDEAKKLKPLRHALREDLWWMSKYPSQ